MSSHHNVFNSGNNNDHKDNVKLVNNSYIDKVNDISLNNHNLY